MLKTERSRRISIRRVTQISDYQQVIELEKRVWGYSDYTHVLPLSMLAILNNTGGLLLGAYAGRRDLIGFVLGFPALEGGHLVHHSHMLAVLPEYRNRGVGLRLKIKQREHVLKQGIDLITWTFDPLQALNAHFNLVKLGVVVEEYKINLYGDSSSPLHRGLATDRFLAKWFIGSERVKRRLRTARPIAKALGSVPVLNATVVNKSGLLQCAGLDRSPIRTARVARLKVRGFLFEIPPDIQEIKARSPALAVDWQEQVRRAFIYAFKKGFVISDFHVLDDAGRPRSFYYLQHGSPSL